MINRKTLYQKYFTLNIHQRINERQHRNALNINHLFSTVISDGTRSNYETTHPKVNNGIYHHIGKTHSKYPESK
jgi:hypothetical protein